jgi:hypothetical protein
VRRPNGGQRRIVHASPKELDKWLATQWAQRPAKSEATTLLNGAKERAMGADIETARELRSAHRQLVAEVRHSLHELAQSCQALALRVTVSETLRLHPPFPNLDRERGDSLRPVSDAPMPLGKR